MRRQLRRGERGASAVEAALVAPVVFLLLFGIIEMGMLFKDYQSVGSMTRTAVRTASAMPRNSGYLTATLNQVKTSGAAMPIAQVEEVWVYRANPTDNYPFGQSSWVCGTKCIRYQYSAGTGTLAYVSGTWDANTQNACSRAAGKPDDRIGVYVKARHAPMSGIIPTIYVADSSALYLEPFPATEGCVGTP